MSRIGVIFLACFLLVAPAFAAPCSSGTSAECNAWCNGGTSSCDVIGHPYCIVHNRSWIECGYIRVVVTCTCSQDFGPHTGYQTPHLEGDGFLLECDNGVGIDEDNDGSAYCLPPASEP